MAAQRPWPTCRGPVGLAEMNSTWTFSPWPASERPKFAPSARASAKISLCAAVAR